MKRQAIGIIGLAALLAGCSKPADKVDAPPPEDAPEQKVFAMAATNVVVEEKQIPVVESTRMVRADFNLDNLDDVAVVEESGGRSSIAIYLRSRKQDDLRREFVRAGLISQPGEYTISALMSRKGSGHIDLLAILNHADGRKEMVHYRSRGSEFVEILRKPVDQPPAAVP